MIRLRSLPALLASLGVVAFVIWLTAFGAGRPSSLYVDAGERTAALKI